MKGYKSVITAFIVFMVIIVSTLLLKPRYTEFVYKNDTSRFFTREYAYKLYDRYINLGDYTDGSVYSSINSIHFDTSSSDNERLIMLSIVNLLKDRNIDLNKELKNSINYNNKYYDGYYVVSEMELNMFLMYNLNIDKSIDVSEFRDEINLDLKDIEVINLLNDKTPIINMVGFDVYFDSLSKNFVLVLNNYSSDYTYSKVSDIEFTDEQIIIYDEYYRYYYNDKTNISSDSILSDMVSTDFDIVNLSYDNVSSIEKVGEYKHIFSLKNKDFVYLKSIKK